MKAFAGGSFVVLFAVLGAVIRPKRLAGLFAAAPAVAIASLIVTVAAHGDGDAAAASTGMLFGAAGFVAFALCVRPLLDRFHAAISSLIACVAWAAVALGGYFLIIG